MATQGPMTGKVFSGRYQVNDRIGIGGMAEVYRAQDNVLGRSVAVKVMLPQFAADPDFTRRFRQEAAAAANLQSPYIVNVYDWGQDGDTYFIVMEFVRGSDLKTAIQARGAINQRKVAEIGAQVCQALTVAHGQDIIHRDIKPQNIMVQPDGNVKVMDFGIARAKNSVNDKTSAVLGTAHYISPEQAQGKELTAASDIYSLGVVMYEATTGKLPFDGPDAVGVALKQVKEYPAPPSEINPDIDPALEDIIMTALEKDPAHRFATANDMRLALNDYLAGRATAGARSNFTEAQTRVIGPAAGVVATDATQTMPTVGNNAGYNNTSYGNGTSYRAEQPKKSKAGIIGALVAIIAVVAIAGVAFALFGGDSGEEKVVPDVTGMVYEEAVQTLKDEGFTNVTANRVYDDSVEEGKVISQDPKSSATQKYRTSQRITLNVSKGKEVKEGTVPDLRDMTAEQAAAEADKYGFTVQWRRSEPSSTYKKDHIISQEPAAGSKAEEGTVIYYVTSSGADTFDVPNVSTGYYTESSARQALENAGLVVTVTEQYSNSVPNGYVISQSLTGKASEGDSITITVSLGPDPSTVTPTTPPSGGNNNGGTGGTENNGGGNNSGGTGGTDNNTGDNTTA